MASQSSINLWIFSYRVCLNFSDINSIFHGILKLYICTEQHVCSKSRVCISDVSEFALKNDVKYSRLYKWYGDPIVRTVWHLIE